MMTIENIEIIKKTYYFIKNEYSFLRSTAYLQNCFWIMYQKKIILNWIIS